MKKKKKKGILTNSKSKVGNLRTYFREKNLQLITTRLHHLSDSRKLLAYLIMHMHMHRCLTIVKETGDNARCLQVNASLSIASDRQCSVHHAHARHNNYYSNQKATSTSHLPGTLKIRENYGGGSLPRLILVKLQHNHAGELCRHEFPLVT